MTLHPSSTTLSWQAQPDLHLHTCNVCGQHWGCDEPACKFPLTAQCLECWATELGEPLPGLLFVLLALAAGLALTVGFFWLVWGSSVF
jgi:hypothetical protein